MIVENTSCWVVTAGTSGLRSQALGLAQAIGLPIQEKTVTFEPPWSWVPARLVPPSFAVVQGTLRPPWPSVVIACGTRAAAPALHVKKRSGGHTLAVYVQNPGRVAKRFDLVIAMPHDNLSSTNVMTVRTALHGITAGRLAAAATAWRGRLQGSGRPLLGVLVGGDNGGYRLSDRVIDELVRLLREAHAKQGVHVVVTPSRRTGAQATRRLTEGLAGEPWAMVWDGSGDNPYLGILAISERLVVTGESISMISEALATGRPVHVMPLEGSGRRHEAFLAGLIEDRVISLIGGAEIDWSFAGHPPIDATGEAARRLAGMLARKAMLPQVAMHDPKRAV